MPFRAMRILSVRRSRSLRPTSRLALSPTPYASDLPHNEPAGSVATAGQPLSNLAFATVKSFPFLWVSSSADFKATSVGVLTHAGAA